MICPKCKEQDKRSKVFDGGSTSTLMSWNTYWDEDGVWHSHNPNKTTTYYYCTEKHSWFVVEENKCSGCV